MSRADAELATDAATGEVVAAWPSIAGNPGKGIAPLKFGSKVKGKLNVTVTRPGYWPLTKTVTL